jgi:hypothetical protein
VLMFIKSWLWLIDFTTDITYHSLSYLTSILFVSTYIITQSSYQTRCDAVVIMFVSTFKTDVILYLLFSSPDPYDLLSLHCKGLSWSWSYGSLIYRYNYLCSQYLSPLKLWVRIPLMPRCIMCVCQWLAAGQWFSPVSSINKTTPLKN